MKKIVSFLILLVVGLFSYGQTIPRPQPSAAGIGYKRLLADSTLFFPAQSGIPSGMIALKSNNINRKPSILADTTNNNFYWFNPKDTIWRRLIADTELAGYVPYTGAVASVNLGEFRLTSRSIATDSILARSSAGGRIVSNSGTTIAEYGLGGGSNFDFHGFAGYDANRSSSFTDLSFVNKKWADSFLALKYGGTVTTNTIPLASGTNTLANSTIVQTATGQRILIGGIADDGATRFNVNGRGRFSQGITSTNGNIEFNTSENALKWNSGNGVIEWGAAGSLFLRPTGAASSSLVISSTGSALFNNGVTAQRGRFTSLLTNKDSIPISATHRFMLTVDTTGASGTNRVNRRDISNFYVGEATFDTTTRILSIPKAVGSPTNVVIPRGTASGASGITALSSNRLGNLVSVIGDNGSTTTFSIRDADSASTVRFSDTAAMLTPYLRKNDTTNMLSPYYRTTDATAALALKLNISDTAAMLLPFVQYSDTANQMNGYLRKNFALLLQDTATAFNPYLQKLDTLTMLDPYTRVQRFLDTTSNLRTLINTKQNILTNPVTGTGANGRVAFWDGTTNQSSSGNLFWDNTNTRLGIGTSTPPKRLSVRNSDFDTEGIALYRNIGDSTIAVGLAQDPDGHGEVRVYNTSGVRNVQIRGGNTAITYFNGSTFGIGTSAPFFDLDVSKTSNGSVISRVMNLGNNTVSDTRFRVQNNDSSTIDLVTYSSANTSTIFGLGAGSAANRSAVLSRGANSAGLLIGTQVATDVIFGTNATARGRITSGGNFLFGGNIDNGSTKVQIDGGLIATLGVTANRFNGSSMILRKDSVPITTTNVFGLTIDTTTGRINRRNLSTSFVDLTTAQTIGGAKSFTSALSAPKIIGNSSTPTIAGGSATYIGTGAVTSVVGNDMAGVITLITGTGCTSTGLSNRNAFTVTFSSAYTNAPIVQIQAIQLGGLASTDGPTNQLFFMRRGNSGTVGFTVYLPIGVTLQDNTTYEITYHVIGK